MTLPELSGSVSSPSDGATGQVTREELYELVWREPMLKVGVRYGVSSSFLARVCTALNVPRPPRGYWAKLQVGKAGRRPPLPEARVEDRLVWNRTQDPDIVKHPPPQAPETRRRKRTLPLPSASKTHSLIVGARGLFTKGRKTEAGLLKPAKKLLVDLVATEALLDDVLAFANDLFLRFEANGHRVVIAPADQRFQREPVDEREVPRPGYYSSNTPSAPYRPTVVLVGSVAIGITIYEMTEQLEARYANGTWVPLTDAVKEKLRRGSNLSWTSNHAFASGRMCVQAFSPYGVANWKQQWRESRRGELAGKLDGIVNAIEGAAGGIARLVDEGERQAEVRRLKQQEEWRQLEAKWERERIAKALTESRAELLAKHPLVLTETVAYHLKVDAGSLFAQPRGSLMFAAAVARAQQFDRLRFKSLAQYFGVSASAMAIRLEELGLVAPYLRS